MPTILKRRNKRIHFRWWHIFWQSWQVGLMYVLSRTIKYFMSLIINMPIKRPKTYYPWLIMPIPCSMIFFNQFLNFRLATLIENQLINVDYASTVKQDHRSTQMCAMNRVSNAGSLLLTLLSTGLSRLDLKSSQTVILELVSFDFPVSNPHWKSVDQF